ncbi:U7 snRNA-associated Sm-like protein LSm10 [Geothlypis trichas]
MGTLRHGDTGTRGQRDIADIGTPEHGDTGNADSGTWGHWDTRAARGAAPPLPAVGGARGGAARARGAERRGRAREKAAAPAMEVSHSVKERTIAENSLVILLQGLRGRVTTVELRDESAAAGRVTSVDAFMNVRLAEVTFTDRQGTVSHLDELFVTGRNIRYVHIPDEVDIRATIEEQLQAIHRVRYFGARDKGRREFLPAKNK